MKFYNLFLIILIFFLSFSCKNNDNEVLPTPNNEPKEGYIYTESNNNDARFLDTANAFLNSVDNTIRISSSNFTEPNFSRIVIICKGTVPDTYIATTNSENYIEFTDANGTLYTSKKSPASVTIKIQEIDKNNWTLSGSITGSLYQVNGNNKITINNGKFNKIPIWKHD